MSGESLTDEELAQIERWVYSDSVSCQQITNVIAPRLIAALRASRAEATNLENQLAAAADVIADMEGNPGVTAVAIRAGWEPWMADLAKAIDDEGGGE